MNNNLIFAHVETQDPVVVCRSAVLSMFLPCGDDGVDVAPSKDSVILSCAAAVLYFSPVS